MVKITRRITGFAVGAPAPTVTVDAPAAAAGNAGLDVVEPVHVVPPTATTARPFPRRPDDSSGFDAWTSAFIRTGDRKFAVCVSRTANGTPFEVWTMGHEQPPGAALVAQLLSQVMLTQEPGYVRYHLDALKKAVATPVELVVPYTGQAVTARSVSHAIALVVEAHAKAIGYVDASEGPSPMMAALASLREPKCHGRFGRASYTDVRNPANGEDFVLFIKEARVEGLGVRPISVWTAGQRTPPEAEGVCKLVSLAMRHRDPAWVAWFLDALARYHVEGAELGFAQVGAAKGRFYGSTWAYVADVLRSRYVQLGLLDQDGAAVQQGMLFLPDADPAPPLMSVPNGKECPQCGANAVVRLDGCDTCMSCGYSKCG